MRKHVHIFQPIRLDELVKHQDIRYHIVFYSKSSEGNHLCRNYYEALNADQSDITYELYKVHQVSVKVCNEIINYKMTSDKGNLYISFRVDEDHEDLFGRYEVMVNAENEKSLIFYQFCHEEKR